MPLEVCDGCGRKYRIWQTAEERLLQAIFGKPLYCKKCAEKAKWPACKSCGLPTQSGLYYNDDPYCAQHMPHANQPEEKGGALAETNL